MNKKQIISAVFAVLTLAMTAFIFINSLQVGEDSAKQSNNIVIIVKKIFGGLGILPEDATLSLVIRKLGHFTEYFILGALAAVFIIKTFSNKYFPAFAAAYGFAVAVCDEFVMQANTAGRGPSWVDVCIDTGGVLVALGIIFLLRFIMKKRNAKRAA